jgi:hypothetical protein
MEMSTRIILFPCFIIPICKVSISTWSGVLKTKLENHDFRKKSLFFADPGLPEVPDAKRMMASLQD